MKKPKMLDIECYIDYYLVSFKCIDTGRYREFEMYEGQPLDRSAISKIMNNNLSVSFNGLAYDLPMITAALRGYTNEQLKCLSDELITSGKPGWLVCKNKKIFVPNKWDHIDLFNVAPGAASLKIYGGRLHSKKLQDLPIEPSANIQPSEREPMRLYCRNDLDTTEDLFNALRKQIALRVTLTEKYGVDLRSKSDAQMAETIIKNYLNQQGVDVVKRQTPVKPFKYRVPNWVKFKTDTFNDVLETVKGVTFVAGDSGQVKLPKELNKSIEFYDAKYQIGIGGLHSQEKRQVIKPKSDEFFSEYDLTSMYPTIIIEQNLYPEHLTSKFLDTYIQIKDSRVEAKEEISKLKKELKIKRTPEIESRIAELDVLQQTYKINLNGSYGKFGSKYSYLYSPELLIQTTITGQLSLLMMIERLELAGVKVVSANTDGINVLFKKDRFTEVETIIYEWELETGYNFECTEYKATYSRDVNSYVAVKTDGSIKGKGAYADPNLMKNPTNEICVLAVKEYLANNTPIEQTVNACKDITKFICIRSVTGGAVWRDEYLGKAVRFYYSNNGDVITYKKNGNKVPKSDGSKPLMNLCDGLPSDLNKQWYIDETISMLADLGINYVRK